MKQIANFWLNGYNVTLMQGRGKHVIFTSENHEGIYCENETEAKKLFASIVTSYCIKL